MITQPVLEAYEHLCVSAAILIELRKMQDKLVAELKNLGAVVNTKEDKKRRQSSATPREPKKARYH